MQFGSILPQGTRDLFSYCFKTLQLQPPVAFTISLSSNYSVTLFQMGPTKGFRLFIMVLCTVTFVFGAPTICTRELGSGTSGEHDAFWIENIRHQGISAFNPDPTKYQVFRNVKVGSFCSRTLWLSFVGFRGER